MYTINGRPIRQDAPFTDANGTQYPGNWLTFASADEKAAIGIEWINDPEPFDDRFYWSAGHAKDIEQVKAMLSTQIKTTAYNLLAPSDYKVVRQVETGEAVDQATLDYRAAVRTAYQDAKDAINSAVSVEALAALQITWPSAEA